MSLPIVSVFQVPVVWKKQAPKMQFHIVLFLRYLKLQGAYNFTGSAAQESSLTLPGRLKYQSTYACPSPCIFGKLASYIIWDKKQKQ